MTKQILLIIVLANLSLLTFSTLVTCPTGSFASVNAFDCELCSDEFEHCKECTLLGCTDCVGHFRVRSTGFFCQRC